MSQEMLLTGKALKIGKINRRARSSSKDSIKAFKVSHSAFRTLIRFSRPNQKAKFMIFTLSIEMLSPVKD